MTTPSDSEQADPVLEGIRRLQASFDAKIRYDEVRERLVESMGEELDAHRQGQLQRRLRPILLDLVTMYDDLTKMSDAPDCPPETVKMLLFFRDTVEQTLARNGVDTFTVEGGPVDRARQKIISVVETDDQAADRHVADRLRVGFSWHDKVLRPEWVSVFAASPAGGTENDHDDSTEAGNAATDDTRAAVEEGAPS